MLDTFKELIANQFEAALCTLNTCIERCPETAWDARIGKQTFSQVAFHALFFADYYLGPNAESLRGQSFHRDNPRFFDDPDTDDTGFGKPPIVDMGAYEFNPCPADLDGDGTVGPFDLAFLLGHWGPNPDHPADLDGDGEVGPFDLAQVLGAWGLCP